MDSFALSLYRVGDIVDVRDPVLGAWFEGQVVDVKRQRPPRRSVLSLSSEEEESEPLKRPRLSLDSSLDSSRSSLPRREERLSEVSWDDAFIYSVQPANGRDVIGVTGRHLRPRAVKRIEAEKVAVGDQVMANYNTEDPEQRGLWFDAVVTQKKRARGRRLIQATVFQGPALSPRKECVLYFTDELFVPELPGTQRNVLSAREEHGPLRKSKTATPLRKRSRPVRRSSVGDPLRFGAVSGVPVGQTWQHRLELSDSAVHRPLTTAIDADEAIGACSVCLTGANTDGDVGEEVVFMGRPSRAFGQTNADGCGELSGSNLALARNCRAKVNVWEGADAADRWREGRAVRVVRSGRGRKSSKFAPASGWRYDGLYKVVSYWSASGSWRFRLRRDDVAPAPWPADGNDDTAKSRASRVFRLRRRKRLRESAEALEPLPLPKRRLRT